MAGAAPADVKEEADAASSHPSDIPPAPQDAASDLATDTGSPRAPPSKASPPFGAVSAAAAAAAPVRGPAPPAGPPPPQLQAAHVAVNEPLPFGDFANVDPQLIHLAQASYGSVQEALDYVRNQPHHDQTPRLLGAMTETLLMLKRNWESILVWEDSSCI